MSAPALSPRIDPLAVASRDLPLSQFMDAGYIAVELHYPTGDLRNRPGHFFRAIRNDTTFVLRGGALGTFGGHDVISYHSREAADEAFVSAWESKRTGNRYKEVFACTEDEPLDIGDDPRATLLESHLEARWAADTTRLIDPIAPNQTWALFEGLLAGNGLDIGATALLEAIKKASHAIDYRTDRIVAPSVAFRDIGLARSFRTVDDWEGIESPLDTWQVDALGSVSPLEANNPTLLAELLLGLTADHWIAQTPTDRIAALVAAARNLYQMRAR